MPLAEVRTFVETVYVRKPCRYDMRALTAAPAIGFPDMSVTRPVTSSPVRSGKRLKLMELTTENA